MKQQPKDYVPMNTGQTLLVIAVCLIAIAVCGAALWHSVECAVELKKCVP